MDDKDKVLDFPALPDPVAQLPEPAEFWECGACNTRVDDNSTVKVLPINVGGNPQTGVPGMTFYVCPTCHVLSMPPEMFDEIHRRMTSRIIT